MIIREAHLLLLIDEPELALHPKAIVERLDIIKLFADVDIQFFYVNTFVLCH